MILALLTIAGVVLLVLVAIGKVPLSYNIRNLTIRWKTTIMTALAFTAVIATSPMPSIPSRITTGGAST